MEEKLTYEDASKELEEILAKLESGTLSLSDATKNFERGQTLVKKCYAELDKAKGKLTVIKEELGKLSEED